MKLIPLKQWVCDSCGAVIEKPEDAWFEWYLDRNTSLETGFRIVHANYPSCRYDDRQLEQENKSLLDLPFSAVIWPDGLGALLYLTEHTSFADIKEFIDIVRRLHIPYYEEARQYWKQAEKDGLLDGSEYTTRALLSIINRYGER